MDMPPSEVSGDIHERFDAWLHSDEGTTSENEALEETQEGTDEPAEVIASEADSEPEQAAEESEAEDSETETLEIDGEKVELPKDVAEKVTTIKKRLEADYTRKTQEAADMKRQAIEYAQQTQAQEAFQRENFAKLAEWHNANSQLAEYDKIDWQALAQGDYATYQQYRAMRDAARDKVDVLSRELTAKQTENAQRFAQAEHQQRQACINAVRTAIPQYDEAMDKKSVETAQALCKKFKLPFDGAALARSTDPLVWVGLTELSKYYDLLAKRPEVTKKVAAAAPTMGKPTAAPPKQNNREQQIRKLLKQGRIREAAQL